MREHLDAHRLSRRTADALFGDFTTDPPDLFQRKFARKDHDVGPLGVELYGFAVGYVALGGDVHLDPRTAGVEDCGDVGGDHGVDSGRTGPVDKFVHLSQFVLIDDGIDRKVTSDTGFAGDVHDLLQIVKGKVRGRFRPHVQLSHTEVDGIGSRLYGGLQCLVTSGRGHQFNIVSFHSVTLSGTIPFAVSA